MLWLAISSASAGKMSRQYVQFGMRVTRRLNEHLSVTVQSLFNQQTQNYWHDFTHLKESQSIVLSVVATSWLNKKKKRQQNKNTR